MGKAARDALYRRTTPGERFDIGLELAEAHIQRLIAEIEVPEGLEGEARARYLVKELRAREG